jgi:hypothetical protein
MARCMTLMSSLSFSSKLEEDVRPMGSRFEHGSVGDVALPIMFQGGASSPNEPLCDLRAFGK